MGTRKINFQRFKEGDNFNNGDTFNRFEQFENDLNEDQNGLHNTGISEGAINHQHLTHSGPLTTTEFSDAPINYGSTILKAECVRNPLVTDPLDHRIFNPFEDHNLDTATAVNPGHLLLRKKGKVLGAGTGGGVGAQNMFITERWKMGTDYKGDADYVPAVLLLFNTFITKGCDRIQSAYGFIAKISPSLIQVTRSSAQIGMGINPLTLSAVAATRPPYSGITMI